MIAMIRMTFALLALACALVAPAGTLAQARQTSPAATSGDLTAQQQEMLAIANQLAKQCSDAMERWLANREITFEKLFSFLYFPIPNTDPAKYRTEYDTLSDRDIQAFEEAALSRSPTLFYAVLVDANGYIPTHNLRYSQPLTGSAAVDLVNNRTKIIHMHRVGLPAARNQAPYLFQHYPRDTGEMLTDLAVPVFVRGRHWGAVRLGFRTVQDR